MLFRSIYHNKVSQYFGTLVVINFGLAIVAMGLASAVGLPNPLLWGVLAGTLNFIPYLGPAIMVVTLFVIGLLSFPALKDAFRDNFGGAIHYTHNYWTPPHFESFPRLSVDCLLGLDVGPFGRISRRSPGHFCRCPEAASFF